MIGPHPSLANSVRVEVIDGVAAGRTGVDVAVELDEGSPGDALGAVRGLGSLSSDIPRPAETGLPSAGVAFPAIAAPPADFTVATKVSPAIKISPPRS